MTGTGSLDSRGQHRGVVIYGGQRRPRARLFCCPYAGGSSVDFLPWRRELPDELELCVFELPGRGRRFGEPPLRSMASTVDHVHELMAGRLDIPFALYGHSMGAVTALELSARLAGAGATPLCLLVSGCAAPHLPSKRLHPLHRLDKTELIRELIRLEGLPPEVLQWIDYLDPFLPTIRADLECRETWQARVMELAIPLHVLGGASDKMVQINDLAAWQGYTSSTFAVRQFPGGHFFIKSALSEVSRYIAAAVMGALGIA